MIRNYHPDDLKAVVSVFSRSVHEVASRDYTPAQVAAWAPEPMELDAWSDRLASGETFVCERNEEVVGFIRADADGCIDLLYVHPECQRQGIARALLEQVISWALDQGARRLMADVSITARPFFEAAGFRVVTSQEVERRGITLHNFHMKRNVAAQQGASADACFAGAAKLER
jgi:putative acetyltransferase